jgi:hypothetical protein
VTISETLFGNPTHVLPPLTPQAEANGLELG